MAEVLPVENDGGALADIKNKPRAPEPASVMAEGGNVRGVLESVPGEIRSGGGDILRVLSTCNTQPIEPLTMLVLASR